MTRYVALLRGVNVGGRNKLAMSDLQAVVASLGCTDVRTYVQSGNVVFTGRKSPTALARSIERHLRDEMDVDTAVIVLSADDLASVLDHTPFETSKIEPTFLHVTFLVDRPEAERVASLATTPERSGDDRCEVGTGAFRNRRRPGAPELGEVYLHCPGGYGRTKLNNSWVERRLGVRATTRNWRTALALAELAGVAGPSETGGTPARRPPQSGSSSVR